MVHARQRYMEKIISAPSLRTKLSAVLTYTERDPFYDVGHSLGFCPMENVNLRVLRRPATRSFKAFRRCSGRTCYHGHGENGNQRQEPRKPTVGVGGSCLLGILTFRLDKAQRAQVKQALFVATFGSNKTHRTTRIFCRGILEAPSRNI